MDSSGIQLSNWTQIAMTISSANQSYFLDGVLYETGEGPSSPVTNDVDVGTSVLG